VHDASREPLLVSGLSCRFQIGVGS
jgi:hypothetical protein